MATLEKQRFEFYRGDTYTRDFDIEGWSLPITKMYFTVKDNAENKKPLLQKTLNNGLTLVNEENGIRTYNLLIGCHDTDNMKTGVDYDFDIEIHSPGAESDVIKKTIITGKIKVKASSTKTCNEC